MITYIQTMGSSESALVALSEAHPLPSALAVSWRYRWLNYPVALPCRSTSTAVVNLPWIAASSLGYYMGKSDRVFGGSGVKCVESSVIGWLAVAPASKY